jgi:phospholipase/lecithinase/hemolysin
MTGDMPPWRFSIPAFVLACAGCSAQLHEPAPHLDANWGHRTWRVHCESARSHAPAAAAAPGADHERWIWAQDEAGREIELLGGLEDGFFAVRGVFSVDDTRAWDTPPTPAWLRDRCLDTLRQRGDGEPLELGRITAARHGEGVDAPILFPADGAPTGTIRRVVVFGDSLSDTGLLKRRLRVFPGEPYWLGRFSNGPVWVDYLEAATGLAIQNHSYGGAAITRHEPLPHEGLLDRLRDRGQFFVSGSIEHQIDDYLSHELTGGRLLRADETAFVIWAGANEYISKEPISSVITTFLNEPDHEEGYRRIADEAIAALEGQVRRLHGAGARRFLLPNLPDLGHTPIVLQNEGYLPAEPVDSEEGRRLELSRRLSALTAYHNDGLSHAAERLRSSLPEVEIVELDAAGLLTAVVEGRPRLPGGEPFDFGFDLESQRVELSYESRTRVLHHPCYTGRYMGTKDSHKVCGNESTALFWDVVHPSSYTHCWQAWFFESVFVDAGWIEDAGSPEEHRAWCRTVSERTRGIRTTRWMYSKS